MIQQTKISLVFLFPNPFTTDSLDLLRKNVVSSVFSFYFPKKFGETKRKKTNRSFVSIEFAEIGLEFI